MIAEGMPKVIENYLKINHWPPRCMIFQISGGFVRGPILNGFLIGKKSVQNPQTSEKSILKFWGIFVRESVQNACLGQPDVGKILPDIFENRVCSSSSELFLETLPNPSQNIPRVFPDTSQDIPNFMKK